MSKKNRGAFKLNIHDLPLNESNLALGGEQTNAIPTFYSTIKTNTT